MKAAYLTALNKIELKEIPIPEINANEILLKIDSCAICGSDIRIFKTGNDRINLPHIIGHEIAGTIAKTGSNIVNYSVGDKISLSADIPCGHCDWCKSGISNNCENVAAFGYEYQGGFAEYIKIDSRIINFGPIVKVKEDISTDVLCLAEPLACSLNGLESVDMKAGKSVLVIGAGPIGCMLISLSKILGASKTILVDIDNNRLEVSSEVSKPDHFINSKEVDLVEEVMKLTDNSGVDVVLTACPNIQAQIDAFSVIKNRGFINFFGGLPKESEKLQIDSNVIHYKELRIVGSHGSTPKQHSIAIDLIKSGRIDLSGLISKKYKLEDINEAFSNGIKDPRNLKIIINP